MHAPATTLNLYKWRASKIRSHRRFIEIPAHCRQAEYVRSIEQHLRHIFRSLCRDT